MSEEQELEYTPFEHRELLDLFEKMTFAEKWQKVFWGLKQPRDTGAYKFAILQVQRLSAPIAAVVVPIVAVLLLMLFAVFGQPVDRQYEVQIMEPETLEDLEEPEEIIEEPPEPPEPIEMDFTPDIATVSDAVRPDVPFSPQPAPFDSVAIVRSPVIMKGIYGSRSPGARGSALGRYGGGSATEGAVLRALRWLKKNQNEDGSWPQWKPAMTGLALLTFLAHGETPGEGEFGYTVEKAIRWLIDNQKEDGSFNGRDGHDYSHPIATYALCEAYGLTRVPMVYEAAYKAVSRIVKGQNPSGGFNYNLRPGNRNDTSYMGWCAQALKAAKMAAVDVDGLDSCIKKAIQGFRGNYSGDSALGGFGYTGPSRNHGLTSVGVLCMQLLSVRDPSVEAGLTNLDQSTYNWEGGGKFNKLYYWYYTTQAMFHSGGERWTRWNKLFSPVLVKNQTIVPKAIQGPDGELKDIGFWTLERGVSGHTDPEGKVMNTCLCALQLQVYYRYLPTFQTPKELALEDEGIQDNDDLEIEVEI